MSLQLTKRKVVAVLAGVAVFSIVQLSAATLGGATSDTLQANTTSVENGGGVTVTYSVQYDPNASSNVANTDAVDNGAKGTFVVSAVTLNFGAPISKDGDVTVALAGEKGGQLLGSGPSGKLFTAPVSKGATTVTIDTTDINVEDVHQVSVALNGQPATVKDVAQTQG